MRRLETMTDRTDLRFKWLVPRAELKFKSLCHSPEMELWVGSVLHGILRALEKWHLTG